MATDVKAFSKSSFMSKNLLSASFKKGRRATFPLLRKGNLRKFLLAAAFAGLFQAPAHAQWLNFGNGNNSLAGGEGSITFSGTSNYANDIDYPVIGYTYSTAGSGPYTITITIAGQDAYNGTGAWNSTTGCHQHFSINDRILIVDHGVSVITTTRNWDLAVITSTSYNPITDITTLTASSSGTVATSMHVASSSTKHYTQVIKVHQWHDVSFNSGATLTCHPWIESLGIGGILPFDCDGTLDLSTNGLIDASGMGPQGSDNPYAGGAAGVYGGAAGVAGSTYEQSGTDGTGSPLGNPYASNGGISMQDCHGTILAGGNGGCGSGAVDGAGPFPKGRPHDFATPTVWTVMSFNAGKWGISGQGPGSGGNGGGGGAGGVLVGLGAPTNGTAGTQAVGHGGQGKSGGTGGGLIYIKCFNLLTPVSPVSVVFKSTGTNGTSAFIISDGVMTTPGNGGNGGNGGDGACIGSGYQAPGGGGSMGQGGNGADGGGGGDGGAGGGIWIGANSSTLVKLNMNASGGAGGAGSSGTPPGANGAQGADGSIPSLCSFSCGSCSSGTISYLSKFDFQSHCTVDDNCNSTGAFTILAQLTNKIPDGSGGYTYNTPASTAGADPRNYAVWDPSTGDLTAYEWVSTTGGSCSGPSPTHGTLNKYYAHFTFPCPLPFWGNIALPSGIVGGSLITWPGAGSFNTATGVLNDATNGQSCTVAACPTTGGDPTPDCIRPCPGKPGPAGDPGPDGPSSNTPLPSESPTSGSDPTGPEVISSIENNTQQNFNLSLMPNPASDNTTLHFNTTIEGQYQLTVIDIQGRKVFSKELHSIIGDNIYQLNTRSYAKGQYIISISNGSMKQQIRFIKD